MNLLILPCPGFFSRYACDTATTYPAGTVALVASAIAPLLLPLHPGVLNHHNEE